MPIGGKIRRYVGEVREPYIPQEGDGRKRSGGRPGGPGQCGPKELARAAEKMAAIIVEFDELLILKTALEQYDLLTKAREEIEKDGFSIPAQQGGLKAHPALRVLNDARCGFLAAWRQLGLGTESPGEIGRPPDSRELKWGPRFGLIPGSEAKE